MLLVSLILHLKVRGRSTSKDALDFNSLSIFLCSNLIRAGGGGGGGGAFSVTKTNNQHNRVEPHYRGGGGSHADVMMMSPVGKNCEQPLSAECNPGVN